jgi:replicative DNA helicase
MTSNAEVEILASMLFNKVDVDDSLAALEAEDFHDSKHQAIFTAMGELAARGDAVDIVTVGAQLQSTGSIESAGGMSYIGGLQSCSGANLPEYLSIVKAASNRRQLAVIASQIAKSVSMDKPPDEIAQDAESKILDLSRDERREPRSAQEILPETYRGIQAADQAGQAITGVPTGFTVLDDMLGGLQKSDLIILAARPSMGKTALAMNIAMNAATEGKKVAVLSMEMSKQQIMVRLLASEARVSAKRLRGGGLATEDWPLLEEAARIIYGVNLWIDDSPALSSTEVRGKLRRLDAKHGLDLIVLDYIQLMHGKGENRQQEISRISSDLKTLAKDLDLPVLALSQLNRASEMRADKRPILSDLRESGSIEQDADVAILLHRPAYYSSDAPERLSEAIVAKQRNGPTGLALLSFDRRYTRFDEPSLVEKEEWRDEY